MPEELLLLSLRILRTLSQARLDSGQKAARTLRLNAKREEILKTTSLQARESTADAARLELIRYLDSVSRKKLVQQL